MVHPLDTIEGALVARAAPFFGSRSTTQRHRATGVTGHMEMKRRQSSPIELGTIQTPSIHHQLGVSQGPCLVWPIGVGWGVTDPGGPSGSENSGVPVRN